METDTDSARPPDPWWILGHRPCTWCHAPIAIVRRPGRPRIYCNQTCRQRAYEHRHGFLHARTVIPLPGQAPDDPTPPSGYEQGTAPSHRAKFHAMRTSVRPEGRRRETLCGLLVRPTPGRWFSPAHPQACETCCQVAAQNPLAHGINASNELSRLRALITETLEHRHPAEAAIRWLATDARHAA